jgi:streptogramin lyase
VSALTLAVMTACQSPAKDDARRSDEPSTGTTGGYGDSVSIEVGTGPCCLVATESGVWVQNHRDQTLQLVDPDTNRAGTPISVPLGDGMLPAGENLALFDPRGLAIFDPDSKESRLVSGVSGLGGVAVDPRTKTVWAGREKDGRLFRVDPDNAEVMEVLTIDGLPSTDNIVVAGPNKLWIATWEGEILLIDVPRRRVLTRSRPFGLAEVDIASAAGSLWAVAVDRGTLLRLDFNNGRVKDRKGIAVAGERDFPRLAEQPDGSLWLASAPNQLHRIDPRSGNTLDSYDIPFSKDDDLNLYYYGGVVSAFGSVWTTVFDDLYEDDAVVRLQLRQEH